MFWDDVDRGSATNLTHVQDRVGGGQDLFEVCGAGEHSLHLTECHQDVSGQPNGRQPQARARAVCRTTDALDDAQPDWKEAMGSCEDEVNSLFDEPTFNDEGVLVFATRMAEIVRTSGNVSEFRRPQDLPRRTMLESTAWVPDLRPSLERKLQRGVVIDDLRNAGEGQFSSLNGWSAKFEAPSVGNSVITIEI